MINVTRMLSQFLFISENVAKGKWKGLRDTFRYVLKKVQPSSEDTDPKWPYFKPLMFLKDQISPFRTILPKETSEEVAPDYYEAEEDYYLDETQSSLPETKYNPDPDSPVIPDGFVHVQLNTSPPPQEFNVPSSSQPVNMRSVKRKATASDKDWFGERKKTALDVPTRFPTPENCKFKGEDYHFFMSLIPHMKNITGGPKMLTYIKIQELIYKAAYGDENSS